MSTIREIRGSQCLMLTPFDADGRLDEKGLRGLVEHLIQCGVHGIIAMGSTGEFFTLTTEERFRLMDVVCEQAGGRVPVSFGCGDTSTERAITLIKRAVKAGASAAMVQAPFYNPGFFNNGQVMLEYFGELSDVSEIPLMLYDGGGGLEIPFDVVRRLAAKYENVKYIKVTVPNPGKVKLYSQELGDRVSPLCGTDGLPLLMLAAGARGLSLGISNVLPKETSRFYEAFTAGDKDQAREIYYTKLLPVINVALGSTSEFIQCFKQILVWQGVLTAPTVRKPLLPVDAVRIEELRAVCKFIGIV